MNRIYLRALEIGDLEFTYKWHADHELYSSLVGPFRFVSQNSEKEWISNKEKFSNQEVNLIICLIESFQPIGMLSLRDIDWISRKGHLSGIIIGESKFRNNGFGTEALELFLEHIFYDLGLNRVYANVLEENLSSINLFEKCGFTKEGILAQHAFKQGEFKNVVVLGILADQYFNLKKD